MIDYERNEYIFKGGIGDQSEFQNPEIVDAANTRYISNTTGSDLTLTDGDPGFISPPVYYKYTMPNLYVNFMFEVRPESLLNLYFNPIFINPIDGDI